jgi:hypothetical protein
MTIFWIVSIWSYKSTIYNYYTILLNNVIQTEVENIFISGNLGLGLKIFYKSLQYIQKNNKIVVCECHVKQYVWQS